MSLIAAYNNLGDACQSGYPKEGLAMVQFRSEIKAVMDELLLGDPRVRSGKMFGYPAYYAGEKLAICLYEDGVGVKLPADIAAELIADDAHVVPFQPLSRPKMREWVQINLSSAVEYRGYQPRFEESIRFVLSLQKR